MIVELCVHGEAKPHWIDRPGYWGPVPRCSGGRVLEQAIIIERDTLARYLQTTAHLYQCIGYSEGQLCCLDKPEVLDALASAQESQPGDITWDRFAESLRKLAQTQRNE